MKQWLAGNDTHWSNRYEIEAGNFAKENYRTLAACLGTK